LGQFFAISANCWEIFNEEAYFGTDGEVVKYAGSLADNGTNIEAEFRQAENYFGTRGRLKTFKASRPIFLVNGAPSVLAGMNIDFENKPLTDPISFSPITEALWDTAIWDNDDWAGGLSLLKDWQTIGEVGTSGAFRIKTVSSGLEVRMQSSDHVFERGGIIA